MSTQTSATDLTARHIRRQDFVPCESAFVDVRLPGSEGKLNYSFIGSGVSQSQDQFVNLREPHGFQIGGVQLPHGHVNNLHLHFTAEVFICARGQWTCFWGAHGQEGELSLSAGDIVSVPSWIFRGFRNTGPDDGFMFTVLGGDDTGGILWAPEVLRRAAETGLYLRADNTLVDTRAGETLPPADQRVRTLNDEDIAGLTHFSVEQMAARRVVRADQRLWSARPFLCSVLPGHGVALAPVIGHGLSQDRDTRPGITNPHGFSAEWLRGGAGQRVAGHRVDAKRVLINTRGHWRLALETAELALGPWDIVSVPAGAWLSLESLDGDKQAGSELLMVCAGDGRKRPKWCPGVAQQALEHGQTLDADGYVAPARLLPGGLS